MKKGRGKENLREQDGQGEGRTDGKQGKRYFNLGSHCGASKKPGTKEILRNPQGYPLLRP